MHWFCTQNHILEPFSVRRACTQCYVTSEPYPRPSQIWCQNVRETRKKIVIKCRGESFARCRVIARYVEGGGGWGGGHDGPPSLIRVNKHIEKTQKFTSIIEEMRWIARGQFSKITVTACLSGWEFEADKTWYGIYVTRHWNWMNSYWMFWIGHLRGARWVSSFCDFRKITFGDLTAFCSFLTRENLVLFRYPY